MLVDPKNPIPIFRQIAEQLRQAIDVGVYKPGEILPSLRQLAVEIKVNPNTIQRAYEALEREGVVESRRGVGIFVANHSRSELNVLEKKLHRAFENAIRQATKGGLTPEQIRHTFELALREHVAGANK